MYKCIYQWPKKSGEVGKKSFDSAVEAVEFMTEGDWDRSSYIITKCQLSLFDSKTGEYKPISYAQLVKGCISELRVSSESDNTIEDSNNEVDEDIVV